MKAVLDTSPFQALHRADVLDEVRRLFHGGVFVPESVEVQTFGARRLGRDIVPDMDDLPWIEVLPVSPDESGALESAPPPGRRGLRRKPSCGGFVLDREEFDVIVLARRLGAVAVLDDHQGLRCATNLGVRSATTLEVMASLVQARLIGVNEARLGIEQIEATGYFPTRRRSR